VVGAALSASAYPSDLLGFHRQTLNDETISPLLEVLSTFELVWLHLHVLDNPGRISMTCIEQSRHTRGGVALRPSTVTVGGKQLVGGGCGVVSEVVGTASLDFTCARALDSYLDALYRSGS
jgi:hypothetical protein